jgi:hypothetical protein
MNVNFLYDKLNSFGRLTAGGNFPDIINLGEASIERMTVDIKLPLGTFSGNLTSVTVAGSDTESGTYTTIVTSGPVTPAMVNDGYGLPVPKTGFKFIRVSIAGTFTGTVEAIINTTLGK